MRLYHHIFYRLYRWASTLNVDRTPEVSAFVGTVIVLWWNLLLVITGFELTLRTRLLPKLSVVQVVIGGALVALPLYLTLLHNGRHRSIFAEFSAEDARQRKLRTIFVAAFIPLSFVLMVVIAVLARSTR
jgi:hypothetical protein